MPWGMYTLKGILISVISCMDQGISLKRTEHGCLKAHSLLPLQEGRCQDECTDAMGHKGAREGSLKYETTDAELPRINLHKAVTPPKKKKKLWVKRLSSGVVGPGFSRSSVSLASVEGDLCAGGSKRWKKEANLILAKPQGPGLD